MTPAMKAEWQAWRELCEYLSENFGVVINAEGTLCDLIKDWGNKYHELLKQKGR